MPMSSDSPTKKSSIGSASAWPTRARVGTRAATAELDRLRLRDAREDDHAEHGRRQRVAQEEQEVVVVGKEAGSTGARAAPRLIAQ